MDILVNKGMIPKLKSMPTQKENKQPTNQTKNEQMTYLWSWSQWKRKCFQIDLARDKN